MSMRKKPRERDPFWGLCCHCRDEVGIAGKDRAPGWSFVGPWESETNESVTVKTRWRAR